MKERLDVLLVKKNLAESREKAKAVIMAGIVYVDDQKEDKAGSMFEETAKIEVQGQHLEICEPGRFKAGEGHDPFRRDPGSGRSAWTWERPPAGSPTACCRTGL